MDAVNVVSERIERPILLFGVEIEAEATSDAAVFPEKEKPRLDFIERNFALVDFSWQRNRRRVSRGAPTQFSRRTSASALASAGTSAPALPVAGLVGSLGGLDAA